MRWASKSIVEYSAVIVGVILRSGVGVGPGKADQLNVVTDDHAAKQ